ncbi:MAG: discoidin domain-containing protein [Verrucomicrobia bacterium]|nr:discoidin domain-containing protein [Verrucomicrobiota bacterium]
MLPVLLWFLGFAAAMAVPVPIAINNHSFESDRNPGSGAFGAGDLQQLGLSSPSGWSVIATDNTATANNGQEIAFGWANLLPADPASGSFPAPQALNLFGGAAIGQVTGVPWSSLSVGDVLKLTLAAGDRIFNGNLPTNTPRWSDDSFFGLSDGLAGRGGTPNDPPGSSTLLNPNWITNIVARTPAITVPPHGYKSGFMGDLTLSHTVVAADQQRTGNVGVFIASVGNRDGPGNGTGQTYYQSFWDNVRLELTTTPGPTIHSFTTDSAMLAAGASATLSWDVAGADTVSIAPGLGTVAASGSVAVYPGSSTTYTLTATNPAGTRTSTLTIDVTGPAVYRYFRFTPTALRNYATANSVQLAEFQMLFLDTPVPGATATNPGGKIEPDGEGPGEAVDGLLNTKWLDFNKGPLVLDYGAPVAVTAYRFATANDATERDPVSWLLEGSLDGSHWSPVDQRASYPVSTERQSWLPALATLANRIYPNIPAAPTVTLFAASPAAITEGEATTLSWDVTGADSVFLVPGGEVAASGSLVVSPFTSTGYSLIASNPSGVRVATANVAVTLLPRGTTLAAASDAGFLTALDGTLIDGPVEEYSALIDVGRNLGEDQLRHLVIPFQLPESLGPGGFLSAELSVNTSIGSFAVQGPSPIRLFAIPGARSSPLTLASDVNDGIDNHLTRGYLIHSALLNSATPLGVPVGSGPRGLAAAGLGYWLTEAYADGANAGKYVFVRLSPEALEIPVGDGFTVATGDSSLAPVPTLSFVFNPAGVPAIPAVSVFSATPEPLVTGESATLTWAVLGATSVSIAPDIGPVAATGSLEVSPPSTTTYTLTATNGAGSRVTAATLVVIPPGAYRYYRFVTTALRGPDSQAFNLAELELLAGGNRLTGATVTSPGSNVLGGTLANLVDGLLSTNWVDRNKAPIILDFGTYVVADAYRLGTTMLDDWDPVSWRLEGSWDGTTWAVLDVQTRYATPTARDTYTATFSLIETPPPLDDFRVTAVAVTDGGSMVQLTWNSEPGASYAIEASDDLPPLSWAAIATAIPSQGAATTYAIPRDSAPRRFYRIAKE